MSIERKYTQASEQNVERRIIQVGNLPDQAGIAAALRRAFAERSAPSRFNDVDPFADLLKQIH